jgi:hypothetical protein
LIVHSRFLATKKSTEVATAENMVIHCAAWGKEWMGRSAG